MTEEQQVAILRNLLGRQCVCGGRKTPRQSFCRLHYFSMPLGMRERLYEQVPGVLRPLRGGVQTPRPRPAETTFQGASQRPAVHPRGVGPTLKIDPMSMKHPIDPNRAMQLDDLKTLAKHERKLKRELTAKERRHAKSLKALKTARKNVRGALTRIGKRRAILNGRLSA
jgi:hypothetical protein